jgi:hypothetical protein
MYRALLGVIVVSVVAAALEAAAAATTGTKYDLYDNFILARYPFSTTNYMLSIALFWEPTRRYDP